MNQTKNWFLKKILFIFYNTTKEKGKKKKEKRISNAKLFRIPFSFFRKILLYVCVDE